MAKQESAVPPWKGQIRVRGATAPSGSQWVRVRKAEQSVWLPRFDFMLDHRALKHRLAAAGLYLSRAEFVELEKHVASMSKFPPRNLIEHPGWTNGCFGLPDGRLFAPDGSTAVRLFAPDPGRCDSSGTVEEWLSVVEQLQGQQLAVFLLMAAFVAPLLELTHRSGNFGFELCGRAGNGKTTLLQLMASVAGRAVMGPGPVYFSSCNTTVNALEQRAQAHRDLPLLLDDATLFAAAQSGSPRASQLKHFVFSLAQGETKARYNGARHQFRTTFVVTTNVPLSDVIAELAAAEVGATGDRLLSLDLDLTDNGNFDFVPNSFPNSGAFARHMIEGIAAHYGTAMPRYLEQLVSLRAEDERDLRGKIMRRADEFITMVVADRSDGSAVRVAEAFGLVRVAGRLAQHFGVLPSCFDCDEAAVTAYRLHLATVERMSPIQRLEAYVGSPGVRDLDAEKTRWLTMEEISTTPGFWKTNREGDREFIVWPEVFKRAFPDWRRVIRDRAVLSLMPGDGRHRGKKRHLRRHHPDDRYFCFRLPRCADEVRNRTTPAARKNHVRK